MGQRLLSYLLVALLSGALGAGVAWRAHPEGAKERSFEGIVTAVNDSQTSIGVKTTEHGTVAGLLANGGPPVKVGQSVSGVLLGDDAQVIRVVPQGD
ncbi:MAG: hypothetical protein JWN22_79 [Nocardioides sp.]|jgi:hypothetical protein|nr:hypothetical protein [Nocardioides sp.]